jgi:hypothetical protein
MLQDNPIVVEVVRQPPITPEISYGSVLLSAVQVVGVILAAGAIAGLIAGAVIIYLKRRREADQPPGTSHIRLRI